MANDIRNWLKALDLERYSDLFAEQEINAGALRHLSETDLKELGIPMGPRKTLLAALASFDRIDDRSEASRSRNHTESAERRLVTVLFSDLVDSTPLSDRLDPEDLRETLRAYQDTVAGIVSEYEGFVANYLGDGIVAYFGWPRAHEDQAAQAVRAGLDAVTAVETLFAPDGSRLAARVGIASGHVVVGDLESENASQTNAISGVTPNLAARLQSDAGSGNVVIGPLTRRLIGHSFALEDRGKRQLRGLREPVHVHRVVFEKPVESRFHAAHGAPDGPFVGRDPELEILNQRWLRSTKGRGQVVTISGAAGIGKSRLMRAFETGLGSREYRRLHFQCSPHHSNVAFHPVTERIIRIAGIVEVDDDKTKTQKLEDFLAPLTADLETVLPLFAELISLQPKGYESVSSGSQQRRQETIEALIDIIAVLAGQFPALLIVEDAHWIDPSTESLTDALVERIASLPVLLLITHRPESGPRLTARGNILSLVLGQLSLNDAGEIISSYGGDVLPPRVIRQIHERAEGVPFYIEELTQSLIERADGQQEAAMVSAIPTSLESSLNARLDRLGEAKGLAQVSAVIGNVVPFDLAVAAMDGDPLMLSDAFDRIVASGLMSRRQSGRVVEYSFRHALLRDAAYATLLKRDCRRLHSRVAEALIQGLPNGANEETEVIAQHYAAGNQPRESAIYWLRAGRHAGERSAHQEAVHDLENGLRQLERVEQSPARDELEFELRVALGASLLTVRGWSEPSVAKNYERAQGLSSSVGDARKLFVALRGIANVYFLNGAVVETRRVVERLFPIAKQHNDSGMLLEATRSAGMCDLFLGRFESARDLLNRANAIYDRAEHHQLAYVYGTDPGVVGLAASSWAHWMLGDVRAAEASRNAALSLAKDIKHPFSLAYAESLAASLAQFNQDADTVCRHADVAISLAEQHNYPYWHGWAMMIRGWAKSVTGNPAEGLDEFDRGLVKYLGTGARQIRNYALTLRAEILGFAGDPVAGLNVLRGIAEAGEETDVRFYAAETLRVQGDLEKHARHSDGCDSYSAAAAMARERGAVFFENRALMAIRLQTSHVTEQ